MYLACNKTPSFKWVGLEISSIHSIWASLTNDRVNNEKLSKSQFFFNAIPTKQKQINLCMVSPMPHHGLTGIQ
jgi:hypothetical protein